MSSQPVELLGTDDETSTRNRAEHMGRVAARAIMVAWHSPPMHHPHEHTYNTRALHTPAVARQ